MIFLLPKYDGDKYIDCINLQDLMFKSVLHEWRRNYGSTRCPDYRPLCTYVRKFVRGKLRYNYDLHYIIPNLSVEGESDVAFYVTKYMMKPSDRERKLQQALRLNLDEGTYFDVWSKVRSKSFASLGLGVNGIKTPFGIEPDIDLVKYVRKCVDISRSANQDNASFFTPSNGTSFPLSRYYKSLFYCYSGEDDHFFAKNRKLLDGNVTYDDRHISQKLLSETRHNQRCDIIDSHDLQSDLNCFFDG